MIQIRTAPRAQPGAVDATEDLVGKVKDEAVASPGGEIELVILDVRRPELVGVPRIRGVVFAGLHRQLESGIRETPHAGTHKPGSERELEEPPGREPRDGDVHRRRFWQGDVALAGQLERLELDLEKVAKLLARANLDGAEIEDGHESRVALQDAAPKCRDAEYSVQEATLSRHMSSNTRATGRATLNAGERLTRGPPGEDSGASKARVARTG